MHAAHARVAHRAQLLFVGPEVRDHEREARLRRPIETIEASFVFESVPRCNDETNADPIAGNLDAADGFDDRERSVSHVRPRPMFALWLITRYSLRMIK